MKRLLIRSEAEPEIEEACLWYEGQRDGLGSDFLFGHLLLHIWGMAPGYPIQVHSSCSPMISGLS
jgi:hypothetical protein